MAKAKSKTSRSKLTNEESITHEEIEKPSPEKTSHKFSTLTSTLSKNRNKILIGLIILGLVLVAYYKKGLFVAATVNGSPISNYTLLDNMNKQYRQKTLEQMINEKLILDEGKKNGVNVSDDDINNKIAELESSFGGKETFDQLLSQQGQTREILKEQVRLQLIIEKLYSNEATVSAQEVTTFVEQNKAQLQATTSAEQFKEAEDNLKQQKVSDIFQQKFQQLKDNAKIQIF